MESEKNFRKKFSSLRNPRKPLPAQRHMQKLKHASTETYAEIKACQQGIGGKKRD